MRNKRIIFNKLLWIILIMAMISIVYFGGIIFGRGSRKVNSSYKKDTYRGYSRSRKVSPTYKKDTYRGYKGKTYRKSESSGLVDWGPLGDTDQEAADVLNDYFDSR